MGRLAACSSVLMLWCRQAGCSSNWALDHWLPRITGASSTSFDPLPYAASRMDVVQWSV